MGRFANSRFVAGLAWSAAIVIAALNAWLLVLTFRGWSGAA
jgi:Mn2+/Fe2+ NRAMP family transporter